MSASQGQALRRAQQHAAVLVWRQQGQHGAAQAACRCCRSRLALLACRQFACRLRTELPPLLLTAVVQWLAHRAVVYWQQAVHRLLQAAARQRGPLWLALALVVALAAQQPAGPLQRRRQRRHHCALRRVRRSGASRQQQARLLPGRGMVPGQRLGLAHWQVALTAAVLQVWLQSCCHHSPSRLHLPLLPSALLLLHR